MKYEVAYNKTKEQQANIMLMRGYLLERPKDQLSKAGIF